jgi:deoxynucleoside triphosphate triphosphohydrolase SAMHD1
MSNHSKIIHDNLWGDIEVSALAVKIIDTPEFQRLHFINQTSCAYKVFPTAKTSRFEHSIGTYHVISTLLEHLFHNQPELLQDLPYDKEFLKIAALCHDIGHGPFSHSFDKALGVDHETRSKIITRQVLHRIGCTEDQIEFTCLLIDPPPSNPQHWYTTLVKNKVHGIDVDKLDYMCRDNLAFGLQLRFDVNRIITNSRVIDNKLCFCERIKDDIFNMFFIRYRLHREVYCHPKILAFDMLIQEIIRATCTLSSSLNVTEFIKLTDMSILLQCPDKNLAAEFMYGRGPWKRINTSDKEDAQTVVITVHPSFCPEDIKEHPLSKVMVYDRKYPETTLRYLRLLDYNMLACCPSKEEIKYKFKKVMKPPGWIG